MGLQQSSLGASAEELRKQQERIQLEKDQLEKKQTLLLQQQQQIELQQLELQQLELQQKQLELQKQSLLSSPSPPHPDGQSAALTGSASVDDMPIPPSDPRYQIYFHLCGLFDESNVRRVMNSHPEETNAHVLCTYLCAPMIPK